MKTNSSLRAFTLIELLVVIAIIAILAAVATPFYRTAMMTAQQNAAMQNARQIGVALRAYANDYGGAYPTGTNSYGQPIQSSNDAFRSLIPTYLDNEQVFVVAASVDGPKADNIIDPYTSILQPGENHYAYVAGLNESSNSLWPLIADGTGPAANYTNVQTSPGGVWAGMKAIVINADSSAHVVPLLGPPTARYIPLYNDSTQNELNVSAYMGAGAQLLEPATN